MTSTTPSDLDPDRLSAVLSFLQDAARLKDTLRTGRTRNGRLESTADHSWRLALLALLLGPDAGSLDLLKILKLCLVHDLGEAISGDTPAVRAADDPDKARREREDLETLCRPLPEDLRAHLLALDSEYAQAATAEARFVKGLDKLETMLQHLIGNRQPGFDFAFNLTYGRAYTDQHPLLRDVRALVDAQTRTRLRSAS